MLDMNLDEAKRILKGGKLEHNHYGNFSIAKRISLGAKPFVITGEHRNAECYEFANGSLPQMERVKKIIETIPDKKCVLHTTATKMYWRKYQSDLDLFEKIMINRVSWKDAENNKRLKTFALLENDYLEMDKRLKEKIVFVVDLKISQMKTIHDLHSFITWANEVGIKKIMFVEDEQERLRYEARSAEIFLKQERQKQEDISNLRALNQVRIEKRNVNENPYPVFLEMIGYVMQHGLHLQVAKAVLDGDELYKLLSLEGNGLKITFKEKALKDKEAIWRISKSHQFVENI